MQGRRYEGGGRERSRRESRPPNGTLEETRAASIASRTSLPCTSCLRCWCRNEGFKTTAERAEECQVGPLLLSIPAREIMRYALTCTYRSCKAGWHQGRFERPSFLARASHLAVSQKNKTPGLPSNMLLSRECCRSELLTLAASLSAHSKQI